MQAKLLAVTDAEPGGLVRTFRLAPAQPLDYLAGQYVEVNLPPGTPAVYDGRGLMRQFTLSSHPSEPALAITVGFADVPHSGFKQALAGLPPGSRLQLSQALGDFVLPLDPATPLVWIAGGIGLTPFRSLALEVLAEQAVSGELRRPISFYYVRSRRYPALFADEAAFQEIRPQPYDRQPQEQAAGRLPAALIQALAGNGPAGALYFVAGSELFCASVRGCLHRAGIEQERIVSDAFLGY